MKTSLSFVLFAAALLLAVIGLSCDLYQTPVEQTPQQPAFSTGSADFTRYVAIGNSLAAGFQSNALYDTAQAYSYPNLLSKAFRTASFVQPLIVYPGVGNRQVLTAFSATAGPTFINLPNVFTGNPATVYASAPPAGAYDNLGIPGALLGDIINTTDFLGQLTGSRRNPFFLIVLRSSTIGRNILAQARSKSPTFITCWIGSNDVLGYATGGGANPAVLTSAATFNTLYRQLLDSLKTIPAKIVVANIPDVTTIPFFSTAGASIGPRIPAGVQLRYQRGTNFGVSFDSTRLTSPYAPPFVCLTGGTYAPFLGAGGGQGGGRFYRDNSASFPTLPPGIDTTKPFGFHPQNPWPTALMLDDVETATASARVANFNQSIDSLARNRGIPVVNMNAVLRDLATRGRYVPGIGTFSTAYITGGAFSYDGVHPSSRGAVMMANEFIKVINATYGATIPPIDYGPVPQLQGLGKESVGKIPGDVGSLDFYLNLIRNVQYY
jgi:lysophospholipase L1-like esterase